MDIEKVIREYGTVLELGVYSVSSVRFLPFGKKEIEAATLASYVCVTEASQKDLLGVALLHLANFVSDEDAIIAARFERYLSQNKEGAPIHPEDKGLIVDYGRIQKEIVVEMKRYQELLKSLTMPSPKASPSKS